MLFICLLHVVSSHHSDDRGRRYATLVALRVIFIELNSAFLSGILRYLPIFLIFSVDLSVFSDHLIFFCSYDHDRYVMLLTVTGLGDVGYQSQGRQ